MSKFIKWVIHMCGGIHMTEHKEIVRSIEIEHARMIAELVSSVDELAKRRRNRS